MIAAETELVVVATAGAPLVEEAVEVLLVVDRDMYCHCV